VRRYLEEYIKTLSDQRMKRIHQILKENALDHKALQKLVDAALLNPIITMSTPSLVGQGDLVYAGKIAQDFSRAQVLCADYEAVCDRIALILNSNKELHQDTILDLSNKLRSLERLIETFAFLYGGDPGYSYSWSDSFDDESQREDVEGNTSTITFIDRDGTEVAEHASINAAEGTLTLGDKVANPVTPESSYQIVLEDCNAQSALLQDNPVTSVKLDDQKELVLKADFYTKARISSPLSDSGETGAQVWVKYVFDTPVAANCVILGNRSTFPVEVLRVQGFGNNESPSIFDITFDEPVSIFSNRAIYFPSTSFCILKVLFNQRNYRVEHYIPESEEITDEDIWNKYSLTPLPSDPFNYEETNTGVTLSTSVDNLAQFYQDLVSEGFHDYGPNTPILHKATKLTKGLYYHYEMYLTGPRLRLDYCVGGKGVFITKPISGGNIIDKVCLQSEEEHPICLEGQRQTPRATSIEYYVTANNGAKWVPIRPSNSSTIFGERIFPNINGRAYTLFHFKCDHDLTEGETPLTIYRNGIKVDSSFVYVVEEDVSGHGVAVELDACVTGGSHRYTADYTPAESPVVSCEDEGMKANSGSATDSSFRLAILLRSNGENPTSPTLYKVQIKGKALEVPEDE